jgi:hypothetical protein
MFFTALPVWANLLILAVLLVVKYFAINAIEKTTYYTSRMASGVGWMAANNIIAGLNAVVTFLILLIPAGLAWSIILGIGDGLLHWLIGYWKVKKMWPKISASNVADGEAYAKKAAGWVMAIHASSYLTLASYVTSYLTSHPAVLTKILTALHLSAFA